MKLSKDQSNPKSIDGNAMVAPEIDSDDEAPEAISSSFAKESILSQAKLRHESIASINLAKKEKRRKLDALLKKQKEESKRTAKKASTTKEGVEEEIEEEDVEEEQDTTGAGRRLPMELLVQAAKEDENIKQQNHLKESDFEQMIIEEEEREKKRKKRERTDRQAGEYTIQVIQQQQKREPAVQKATSFKDRALNRRSIQRVDSALGKAYKTSSKRGLLSGRT